LLTVVLSVPALLKTKNSIIVNPSIVFFNHYKGSVMSNSFHETVMKAANEAVFQRQLSTEQAVKYILSKTNANKDLALDAVRQVTTFYK
jgi:hypothetical protein